MTDDVIKVEQTVLEKPVVNGEADGDVTGTRPYVSNERDSVDDDDDIPF